MLVSRYSLTLDTLSNTLGYSQIVTLLGHPSSLPTDVFLSDSSVRTGAKIGKDIEIE